MNIELDLKLNNQISGKLKFGFKKITSGYSSFSRGDLRTTINLGTKFDEKLILPLICYEVIYPGKIKKKNQFPEL